MKTSTDISSSKTIFEDCNSPLTILALTESISFTEMEHSSNFVLTTIHLSEPKTKIMFSEDCNSQTEKSTLKLPKGFNPQGDFKSLKKKSILFSLLIAIALILWIPQMKVAGKGASERSLEFESTGF